MTVKVKTADKETARFGEATAATSRPEHPSPTVESDPLQSDPILEESGQNSTDGGLGSAGAGPSKPRRAHFRDIRAAIAVGSVIVFALAGLCSWLGYRTYQTRQELEQRELYVQTARQAALNLTTINYTRVEADVRRVLDSATAPFRDEFHDRAPQFEQAVTQAQSNSEGSIAEAGVESEGDREAQVLIVVSVKTSIAGAPPPAPRAWRLRVGVQRVGDAVKVANVEFVP